MGVSCLGTIKPFPLNFPACRPIPLSSLTPTSLHPPHCLDPKFPPPPFSSPRQTRKKTNIKNNPQSLSLSLSLLATKDPLENTDLLTYSHFKMDWNGMDGDRVSLKLSESVS